MKNIKKILSVALVLVMVLTAAPLGGFVGLELPDINWGITASAEELPSSGYCGDNVTYTYDSTTKELVFVVDALLKRFYLLQVTTMKK